MNTQLNVTSSNDSMNSNFTNNTRRRPFFGAPPPCPSATAENVATAVCYSILIFMILMGNSLVIASFKVNRRLRTKTNYFILSLAFADLAIGTISVPLWIYITLCPAIGSPMHPNYSVTQIWTFLDIVVGVSSILNLTMISLERGYALLRPIQHRHIKKRFILAAILTAWSLALLAGSLRLILPRNSDAGKSFGFIVTVPFFIVPLIIILVTYVIIFRIASAHARGRGVRSFKKDLRIATTVAVVVGFFSVAWLPFFSINFLFSLCFKISSLLITVCSKIPPGINYVKFMQYGNSACNPIIYGFRNKDFKSAFKKILFKLCGKEVTPSSYTRSTYVKTARSRFVRSDSSFDESQSVLYPDQIVPPGMYDMRESYRSAIDRGHKSSKKRKPPKKDLAHGLMALSVEAFNMPVDSVENNTSKSNPSKPDSDVKSDTNSNTTDTKSSPSKNGVQTSLDIDIYPYEGTRLARDKGVINESFVKSQEDVAGITEKRSGSHVSFADTNGIANGGLVSEEHEQGHHRELTIPLEQKERSYSDVTPMVSKNDDRSSGNRRSSLT